MTRLAVLGSPIGHSLSPAIHAAAYRALGLDWEYDRVDVPAGGLAGFVAGLGPEWRGLSLTMPLKREALALADETDAVAGRTGQANTLLLGAGAEGIRAANTDVMGVVGALAGAGMGEGIGRAVVIGGGATAESAVLALTGLGARVTVAVRDPARADRLSGSARIERIGDPALADALATADAVVSTTPGGVDAGVPVPRAVSAASVLLDVAYAPWPSALALSWTAAGGAVVRGTEMLLRQALGQVRMFVGGDPAHPLPDEGAVFRAMRAAVEGS